MEYVWNNGDNKKIIEEKLNTRKEITYKIQRRKEDGSMR